MTPPENAAHRLIERLVYDPTLVLAVLILLLGGVVALVMTYA